MNYLVELLKSFVPHLPSQQECDDAYLSEAVDLYDLERRIWEMDHRACEPQSLGGAVH
jgi:hypothetical protein